MADDSRDAHQAARPAGHVIGFLMPRLTGLEVAAAIRARQELHDPNRDDQRVRDAGRRAAGHRGGAALHVQARHRRAVRGDDGTGRRARGSAAGGRAGVAQHPAARETGALPSAEPRMARRCTDQGPSDQGPIDPSRQSEHPGCDIMFAWLVPLASLTVTAQRSLPRFSDGVDVSS